MENLVCAELVNGLSLEMLQDKMVLVLNDGGLFVITTVENSEHYTETFYPLDSEVQNLFNIVVENGKVVSKIPQENSK